MTGDQPDDNQPGHDESGRDKPFDDKPRHDSPGRDQAEPVDTPVLTIVRGHPTAEELAALTAVVLSLQPATATEAVRSPARHWVRREQLRLGPKPGPGAWRRSRG